MHPTEKKHEIIRLAEMFARRLGDGSSYGEHRFGEIGISGGTAALKISLYQLGQFWPTLVYKRERDHKAERTSVNREMGRMGVAMSGVREIYSETIWEPKHADKTLAILQQALVLDLLAEGPEVEGP
jgi:hypothetical protein